MPSLTPSMRTKPTSCTKRTRSPVPARPSSRLRPPTSTPGRKTRSTPRTPSVAHSCSLRASKTIRSRWRSSRLLTSCSNTIPPSPSSAQSPIEDIPWSLTMGGVMWLRLPSPSSQSSSRSARRRGVLLERRRECRWFLTGSTDEHAHLLMVAVPQKGVERKDRLHEAQHRPCRVVTGGTGNGCAGQHRLQEGAVTSPCVFGNQADRSRVKRPSPFPPGGRQGGKKKPDRTEHRFFSMIQPFQEKQHANRTTRFSELPEIVFDSWHYRHPVRRGGPCRLRGRYAARSGLPLWGVWLRGRDRGSGFCLTVYQRAGMGTAASRGHPGHSGRHRRLCLARHHRLRLPLPDCGLGHCHRHHADRRCLYAPTGYWARIAAGAGRVLLDSLRRSHRYPARCRAGHCGQVDRHLRDRLWHPVHRALLPGALFGFSSDLTCHTVPRTASRHVLLALSDLTTVWAASKTARTRGQLDHHLKLDDS